MHSTCDLTWRTWNKIVTLINPYRIFSFRRQSYFLVFRNYQNYLHSIRLKFCQKCVHSFYPGDSIITSILLIHLKSSLNSTTVHTLFSMLNNEIPDVSVPLRCSDWIPWRKLRRRLDLEISTTNRRSFWLIEMIQATPRNVIFSFNPLLSFSSSQSTWLNDDRCLIQGNWNLCETISSVNISSTSEMIINGHDL